MHYVAYYHNSEVPDDGDLMGVLKIKNFDTGLEASVFAGHIIENGAGMTVFDIGEHSPFTVEVPDSWEHEGAKLNPEGLTENEIKVMIAIRNNCYEDGIQYGTWSFAVCDESGIPEKQYRGVASSLIKKGLIEINDYEEKGRFSDMTLSLTDLGKERYSDYDR